MTYRSSWLKTMAEIHRFVADSMMARSSYTNSFFDMITSRIWKRSFYRSQKSRSCSSLSPVAPVMTSMRGP